MYYFRTGVTCLLYLNLLLMTGDLLIASFISQPASKYCVVLLAYLSILLVLLLAVPYKCVSKPEIMTLAELINPKSSMHSSKS